MAIEKSYGGVQALKGVSLRLPQNTIVGLIGPNGSGKTTFLNCLSGLVRPTAGDVKLDGDSLRGRPPHAIASRGLARTFQSIRLFDRLSVLQNLEVSALGAGRASRHRAREWALQLLSELGIGHLADTYAEQLSYGDRRRVEIGRALATTPRFLLLDEPAAGMNDVESTALGELLEQVRATRGCGILLIDHDLRLIMRRCSRIHVLNEGRKIAEGTPSEVQNDRGVVAAYIGEPPGDE